MPKCRAARGGPLGPGRPAAGGRGGEGPPREGPALGPRERRGACAAPRAPRRARAFRVRRWAQASPSFPNTQAPLLGQRESAQEPLLTPTPSPAQLPSHQPPYAARRVGGACVPILELGKLRARDVLYGRRDWSWDLPAPRLGWGELQARPRQQPGLGSGGGGKHQLSPLNPGGFTDGLRGSDSAPIFPRNRRQISYILFFFLGGYSWLSLEAQKGKHSAL